ncbi:MAG TPA: phosphoglycerate mutase [Alphaproteobacteria bacterium]|nr:phosphoglycerate mutase [Alphaproteobacteria bacterium]
MTHRGRTLACEIAAALAFKVIALILLYFAFFGPSHRVDATTDRVASNVFGQSLVERGD